MLWIEASENSTHVSEPLVSREMRYSSLYLDVSTSLPPRAVILDSGLFALMKCNAHLCYISYFFFLELESDMDSGRYLFLNHVFASRAFGQSDRNYPLPLRPNTQNIEQ